MSYGIVAQFVERKNKLYAYEVRGFDGGSFQTMIKENANNYRGLRQVKNPDEPTDGSFVGCYYEPKMETAVMFKDDDQTNAGLAILTTFTFVTNDDLTFLQETNKFYVFTVNKPFVDGDKTYILNGQAIRMTKQSGDVDLRSQGLPTNRNYSGEMWCLGLQEISKLINDQKSNIIFYHNEISELPDDAEVWIDKNIEIGLESQTLIQQITINANIKKDDVQIKNINLDMKTSNIYFFPLLIKPVTASADEIYFYSQSLDEQLMNKSDIEKIINNLKNKNAIWSKESDAYFKLNDVSWNCGHFHYLTKCAGLESDKYYSAVFGADILSNISQKDALWLVIYSYFYSTSNEEAEYWRGLISDGQAIPAWGGIPVFFTDIEGGNALQPKYWYSSVARYSQNKNDFLNFKKYIYAFNRLIVFPNFLIGKRTSDISQVISYFTFNNFSLTTQYYDGTDQTKASAFLQRHNFEDSKGRYILNFDTPEISAIDNISFKYKSLYFDLKKRIVDDKIFCFPKINNISKNFSFKDENQYIFPTLPDTLGIIDTTTDFLNLDISSPDIFKYLVFIPAENIDTFNDLFNLFLNQNSNVFNSSMLQELREKIDPYFAQNTFIKLSMHLVGEFADDKYKITKINHIDFFNIYGSEATINIVFNYSQGNLVKKFNFAIKTALYSKINNNKCHTQIAI